MIMYHLNHVMWEIIACLMNPHVWTNRGETVLKHQEDNAAYNLLDSHFPKGIIFIKIKGTMGFEIRDRPAHRIRTSVGPATANTVNPCLDHLKEGSSNCLERNRREQWIRL